MMKKKSDLAIYLKSQCLEVEFEIWIWLTDLLILDLIALSFQLLAVKILGLQLVGELYTVRHFVRDYSSAQLQLISRRKLFLRQEYDEL